jgi:putative acetyltransferase
MLRDDTAVLLDRLRPEDVPGLVRLVRQVQDEFGIVPDSLLDADLENPLFSYEAVWVARRDGEVVGSVGLRRDSQDAYYLKRMYLLPELRGRGLGRALLAAALDHARASGARRVDLDTSPSMPDAQRLYERAGFRRTGTRTESGDRDTRCEILYTYALH